MGKTLPLLFCNSAQKNCDAAHLRLSFLQLGAKKLQRDASFLQFGTKKMRLGASSSLHIFASLHIFGIYPHSLRKCLAAKLPAVIKRIEIFSTVFLHLKSTVTDQRVRSPDGLPAGLLRPEARPAPEEGHQRRRRPPEGGGPVEEAQDKVFLQRLITRQKLPQKHLFFLRRRFHSRIYQTLKRAEIKFDGAFFVIVET